MMTPRGLPGGHDMVLGLHPQPTVTKRKLIVSHRKRADCAR